MSGFGKPGQGRQIALYGVTALQALGVGSSGRSRREQTRCTRREHELVSPVPFVRSVEKALIMRGNPT